MFSIIMIDICPAQIGETGEPGVLRLWALVGSELHQLRLVVPRVFYVNQRSPREQADDVLWRKCSRILPRARPSYHLYEFTVPEQLYREHSQYVTSHTLITFISK